MNFSFSKSVLLLIAAFFLYVFGSKIQDAAKTEQSCFQAYDGFGYYMYLPHLFEKGHLHITREWAAERQLKYCPGAPIYQLQQQPNGNAVNIYHMGLALIELPSYAIGELAARVGGFPQDGMSKPYHIAALCNALFFIFLGLLFLRKLLLLYLSDRHTGLALILLYAASNIYITFSESFQLQHLYLFTLNTIFLYYLLRYVAEKRRRFLLISAIVFGISCFVRPTQVLWGIVPLILLYENRNQLKPLLLKLIWFPLFAFVFNIPHFLYWKLVGDSWLLPNLHIEDIVLTDPNLYDFLFSFKKGWLLYTPVFILLIPGFVFLYREQRKLFWAFLAFTACNIYVLSTWECWWYAASYSSRVLVDCYPLLAIVLGFAIRGLLQKRWLAISLGLFAAACITLNSIQSVQFLRGYLHFERMTQQQYAYIFGKTHIPDYHTNFLEIDRGDNHWPENPFYTQENGFRIEHTRLLTLDAPVSVAPGEDKTIDLIPLLELLQTDESLIEVSVYCQSSDTALSSFLQLQMMSRYNTYFWNSAELSLNRPADSTYQVNHRFNLLNIHHAEDVLNVYVNNPNQLNLHIDSLHIDAYSLIRE